MKVRAIHLNEALQLLADRQPHTLSLWKLSTGDLLRYEGVTMIGAHRRQGLTRVKFPQSGEVRALRDISLYEIDGLQVYF